MNVGEMLKRSINEGERNEMKIEMKCLPFDSNVRHIVFIH